MKSMGTACLLAAALLASGAASANNSEVRTGSGPSAADATRPDALRDTIRTASKGTVNSNHGGPVDMVSILCGGKVTFGKGGGRCSNTDVSKKFAEHIDKYLLSCVQRAADQAGISGVQAVNVNGSGCFADRNINVGGQSQAGKPSNHSRGLACDISSFTLKPSGQEMQAKVPGANSGNNRTFYDSFRRCWAASMPSCTPPSIGAPGHEPPPVNGDHADHIHLQLPPDCNADGGRTGN